MADTLTDLASQPQQFLLECYTQEELTQVLFFKMQRTDLNRVANGTNFEHVVFSLITWSVRQGNDNFLRPARVVARARPARQAGRIWSRPLRTSSAWARHRPERGRRLKSPTRLMR